MGSYQGHKKHGKGTETFSDGKSFKVEYNLGKMHG